MDLVSINHLFCFYFRDIWHQLEDLFRGRIKRTLECDFHKTNPLFPENKGQFEAVTTSFAFISGSKDIYDYMQAMKNVASLVKTGGHFVYATLLDSPFYLVGEEKFSTLSETKTEVVRAIEDSKIEVLRLYENESQMDTDYGKYNGAIVVPGRKK